MIQDALFSMVTEHGLKEVVRQLVIVCSRKAKHPEHDGKPDEVIVQDWLNDGFILAGVLEEIQNEKES